MIGFREPIKEYLEFCSSEKKLNEKTIRAYNSDLLQYLRWSIESGSDFDVGGVRAYISYLNSNYSVSSTKRKLASLRAYAFYLQEKEARENPFLGIKINIKQPRRLPRTIPTESLSDLFRLLYSRKCVSERSSYARFCESRDRMIFELLIATGLRVSELCSLNKGSFSPSYNTVLIMGKGAKERMLQIENENTVEAIMHYEQCTALFWPEWGKACDSPLILNRFGTRISDQSVRNIVSKWAKLAGLSGNVTPHMFRHSFATLLLENDVDIRYIQRFLGHSSIQTTEIYTYVTSAKMRDILKNNNPRSCLRP